jgi:MbtH protein
MPEMSDPESPTDRGPRHKVVVNHEGQYSLWFADRENPPGWADAGKVGTKEECLSFVEEVWTDMRPLSLRARMGERA